MTITVRDLRKSYGRVQAVRGVSFEVPTGSLFAFLGRNGAGKSTTIGCLTTTVAPDAGELAIDGDRVGHDDAVLRRRIGVVFQDSVLDDRLTVRENLALRAAFYGLSGASREVRIGELVDLLQLEDFASRRYDRLSGGQRRRVDIARALLHQPDVLFLDEPTAGLDPQSREQLWRAVRTLRDEQGLTVFLTTHYMEETERADRVCIIEEGRIVAEGTPAELRRDHSSSVLSVTADPRVDSRIAALGGAPTRVGGMLRIAVPDAGVARAILADLGDEVRDFEFRHGTMDDVFLALTGRPAVGPDEDVAA